MIILSVMVVSAMLLSSFAMIPVKGEASASTSALAGTSPAVPAVPGAPRNLVADQGPGFVWLLWNHPDTNGDQLIKKYYIYRGTSQGGETPLDSIFVGATEFDGVTFSGLNLYNDTTAAVGLTYWYKITASSDAGNSSFSNEVSATPSNSGTLPSAPSITAYNMKYGAWLNWSAPVSNGSSPVRFYYLERDDGIVTRSVDTYSFQQFGIIDEDATYIKPGHTYNYHIRAINSFGSGAQGSVSVFIGGTLSVPSAPELTATGGNSVVALYWSQPDDPSSIGFTQYKVYRSFPGSSSFTFLQNVSSSYSFSGSYTDTAVSNGNNYYYKVVAENANGLGAYSNIANATPEALSGVNLGAYPGNNQVLLAWYPLTYYTGYNLYKSTTPGGQGSTPFITLPPSPMTWFDNDTDNGQTYYYKIQGTTGAINGTLSAEVSVTPGPGSAPSTPTLLATPDSSSISLYSPINSSSIVLWWEVYRGDTPGGEGSTPYDNQSNLDSLPMYLYILSYLPFYSQLGYNINFLDYQDGNVTDDVNQYYTVRAHNMYGWSEFSNEATAFSSPTGDVPDPVSDLTATGETGGIRVTWSKPTYQGTANMLNYVLLRNSSKPQEIIPGYWFNWTAVSWNLTGSSLIYMFAMFQWYGLGPQSYLDTNVVPGLTYKYIVLANNEYGISYDLRNGFSNEASAQATGSGTLPSAPQNLVATAGPGYVVLTWTAPSNAGTPAFTAYDIYRSTSSGSYGAPIAQVPAGTLTYNNTGLTGGTPYFFVVKAVNTAGSSPASNQQTAVPSIPPRVPGAPSGLVANAGVGFVLLNWTAPSDAGNPAFTRYDIYRGTSSGVFGSPIGNVVAGTLSFNDTTPVAGTPYFYVVKAFNTAGPSLASNEVTATAVLGPQVPTASRNLTASSGDNYVLLSWIAPLNSGNPAFTRYDIYRGATLGSVAYLANVTESTLTFNDTTALNGITYVYIVKAVNTAGSSPASNDVSATPNVPPGAPGGLVATTGAGYILLNWTAPSNPGDPAFTIYSIYRSESSGVLGSNIGNVSAGTVVFNDTTAIAGTPYYYVVKAANNAVGPASNEATATATPGPQAPSAVMSIGSTHGSNWVNLFWQMPANPGNPAFTRYDIYRGANIDTLTYLANVTSTTQTYNDITALNGNTYIYSVKAVNTVGASPFGTYLTVNLPVPGTPPGTPTGLSAVGHRNYITLSWTAPTDVGSGISNYLVYRGTTAGGEGSVPIASVTGTTFQDNSAVAGTPYFYKVKANNSYGQSTFSNEATGTALANTAPSAPQSFTATAGVDKVTLAWLAPADNGGSAVTSYQIFRSIGGGAAAQIGSVAGSILTFVDTTGTAGTSYTYYVKAVNEIGAGTQSASQSATPQPSGGGTDNTILYAGIVIVIVVIVAILAFVMMRRPKTPPTPPKTP